MLLWATLKNQHFLEEKGEHFALTPPPPVTVLFTFENVENVGRSLTMIRINLDTDLMSVLCTSYSTHNDKAQIKQKINILSESFDHLKESDFYIRYTK